MPFSNAQLRGFERLSDEFIDRRPLKHSLLQSPSVAPLLAVALAACGGGGGGNNGGGNNGGGNNGGGGNPNITPLEGGGRNVVPSATNPPTVNNFSYEKDLLDVPNGTALTYVESGTDAVLQNQDGQTVISLRGVDPDDEDEDDTYNIHFLKGTSSVDTLAATNRRDSTDMYFEDWYIRGGAGDDTITGSDGDDVIHGEAGNDTLNGGADEDELYGGAGNDTLNGGADDDELHGGAGADRFIVTADDSLENGDADLILDFNGSEGDKIVLDDGVTEVYISYHDFEGQTYTAITKTRVSDNTALIYAALPGKHVLTAYDFESSGGRVTVTIENFDTEDSIFNIPHGTVLTYTQNNDGRHELHDSQGNVVVNLEGNIRFVDVSQPRPVHFLTGDDNANTLTAANNGEAHYLNGKGGNDRLTGSSSTDFLYGGAGDDTLNGGAGEDWLIGGAGNDTLNGGVGDDTLNGGAGRDEMSGGGGSDKFIVATKNNPFSNAIIDFNRSESDKIVLSDGATNVRFNHTTAPDGATPLTVISSAAQNSNIYAVLVGTHTLTANDFESAGGTVTVRPTNPPQPTDQKPTSFSLSSRSTSIDEGRTTAKKLADINISDDGQGTNTFSVSPSRLFEIRNSDELWLKSGVELDYETASDRSHTATVTLSATGTGSTPRPVTFRLTVDDVDETPQFGVGTRIENGDIIELSNGVTLAHTSSGLVYTIGGLSLTNGAGNLQNSGSFNGQRPGLAIVDFVVTQIDQGITATYLSGGPSQNGELGYEPEFFADDGPVVEPDIL